MAADRVWKYFCALQPRDTTQRYSLLASTYYFILTLLDVIILDFNRARITGNNQRDIKLKQQELERMEDLLTRAMAGKLAVDFLPKEVRMLL